MMGQTLEDDHSLCATKKGLSSLSEVSLQLHPGEQGPSGRLQPGQSIGPGG